MVGRLLTLVLPSSDSTTALSNASRWLVVLHDASKA